ncbi:MAG: hypothetical protein ABIA75_10985 [Candidatus Neomarinimicrobiota bacterium]
MKNLTPIVSIILLFTALVNGQVPHYAIQQYEKEWQDYTSFQRRELLSFSGFLYADGHLDRALLGYFQYLYRFPGDSIEPVIYYRIARCYEQTGNPALAVGYYRHAREIAGESDDVKKLSWYRLNQIYISEAKYDTVMSLTENSSDPYDLIFRGYVHLHRMEWSLARQAFKAAEAQFNQTEYSRLIRPLQQAIDEVGQVPRKKGGLAFICSLVPGGGFAYLDVWSSAAASLLTVSGLTLAGIIYPGSNLQSFVLIGGGLGIYGASIWKTVHSVSSTNISNLQRYIDLIIARYPASRFMRLEEPEII